MPELIVAEEHRQIYDLWRESGRRGLRLVHLDFHCDMRGLLIDRRRGFAWRIDATDARAGAADSGNFLAHAIAEGIVASVRWVHDDHGGRRFDVATVKYESDLTALPHRLRHRRRRDAEVPLRFEEISLSEWDGMRPGEHLDIDWDGLASVDYSEAHIGKLTSRFLERELGPAPDVTYLVYSPGYSHPDRARFERFADALSRKLGANLRALPAPEAPSPRRPAGLARRMQRAAILGLRRVGIY